MPPKFNAGNENDWPNLRLLIEYRLDETDKAIASMSAKLDKLREDLTWIKVRVIAWGMLAGAIPVGLALLFQYLSIVRH